MENPIKNGAALIREKRTLLLTDGEIREMSLDMAAKMRIEEIFRGLAREDFEPGMTRTMLVFAYCLAERDRLRRKERMTFEEFCDLLPDDDARMAGIIDATAALMGFDRWQSCITVGADNEKCPGANEPGKPCLVCGAKILEADDPARQGNADAPADAPSDEAETGAPTGEPSTTSPGPSEAAPTTSSST